MSCGDISLQLGGIKYEKYYASEVDKHAIKVCQAINPDVIQLGDITKWKEWNIEWHKVDLFLAGSPCQGFSFAGKQLAFDDPRSKLFFVFMDILNHIKSVNPNVKYLLENVRMKVEHENVISRLLNIKPLIVNSALLSAQNRVRLYWTNISNIPDGFFGDAIINIKQPTDKGLLLRDILEQNVPEKYFLSTKLIETFETHCKKKKAEGCGFNFEPVVGDSKGKSLTTRNGSRPDDNFIKCVAMRGRNNQNDEIEQQLEFRNDGKTNTLTSVQKDNLIQIGNIYDNEHNSVAGRVYTDQGKSVTLSAQGGGGGAKTGLYAIKREVIQLNQSTESQGVQPFQQNRVYDIDGIMTTLDTDSGRKNILIPEATSKGFIEIQPGECFDFENPNSETRRGRKMADKSNTLMAKQTDFMQYTTDYRIRRLTPRECGRLQTVPEHIIDIMLNCGVSDTQLYKMFGNGWTVEVITYILSHLNK